MLRARVLSSAVPLLLVLAACGAEDRGVTSTGDGPAEGAGETVVVDHRFGSTEVPVDPERVVTIDLQWTDVMLSLGVEPVGYAADPFVEGGTYPWQELPGDAEALDVSDGLPLERIAALQPDLIVGNYSVADEEVYDQLTDLAPTVPDLGEAQVGAWQDLVEVGGLITGDEAAADEVVTEVEDRVAATAEAHPELDGASFALAQYQVGQGMVIVADTADGSSVLFQDLGMELFAPVRRAGEEQGGGRLEVSTERADLLRADLLTFLVNGGDGSDLDDIPGFDDLPGTVALLDLPTVVGMNTPTPLSIPSALDALDPFLAEVRAG